jgi:DNA modification methylase
MTPYYDHAGIQIFHGDVLKTLAVLPDNSVQCVVTSPPYWGLHNRSGSQRERVPVHWD